MKHQTEQEGLGNVQHRAVHNSSGKIDLVIAAAIDESVHERPAGT